MSMHAQSVPVYLQYLASLDGLLDKAAAAGMDETPLLETRLHADMFPLARQVQIACDFAKGAVARLAGIDAPAMPDEEKTIAELKARIAKTADFIRSVTPDQIDGSESKTIVLKIRDMTLTFTGADYLRHFALPQFFFHTTTAYGILRHAGVAIGKRDYIGRPPLHA